MCVEKCPVSTGESLALYHPDGITYHIGSNFKYSSIQSHQVGRYCIPYESESKSAVDIFIESGTQTFVRSMGDVSYAFPNFIFGYILLVSLGYFTIYSMKTKILIKFWLWFLTILCFFAPIITSLYFYLEYQKIISERCYLKIDENECGGVYAKTFMLCFYVLLAFGSVYAFVCLLYIRRFGYAIEAIEKSFLLTRKVMDFKYVIIATCSVLFSLDLIFFIMIIGCAAFGTVTKIYAPAVDQEKILKFDYSIATMALFMIQIFNGYVISLFVLYFQHFLVSYAVCSWYFTKLKESTIFPELFNLKSAVRWHLGTIIKLAIYTFLLSYVNLIMTQIKNLLSWCKQERNLVRFVSCIFAYPLGWYEDYWKYLSIEMFVITSIFGDNYSSATKKIYYI